MLSVALGFAFGVVFASPDFVDAGANAIVDAGTPHELVDNAFERATDQFDKTLSLKSGPADIDLVVATLHVPDGVVFTDANGAKLWESATNNASSGKELALLGLKSGARVLIEWADVGTVYDDDANELDPQRDTLLARIKNAAKKPLVVDTWLRTPTYDPKAHDLSWCVSIAGASGSPDSVHAASSSTDSVHAPSSSTDSVHAASSSTDSVHAPSSSTDSVHAASSSTVGQASVPAAEGTASVDGTDSLHGRHGGLPHSGTAFDCAHRVLGRRGFFAISLLGDSKIARENSETELASLLGTLTWKNGEAFGSARKDGDVDAGYGLVALVSSGEPVPVARNKIVVGARARILGAAAIGAIVAAFFGARSARRRVRGVPQ